MKAQTQQYFSPLSHFGASYNGLMVRIEVRRGDVILFGIKVPVGCFVRFDTKYLDTNCEYAFLTNFCEANEVCVSVRLYMYQYWYMICCMLWRK